jgi:hypothetical protein
VAAPPAEKAPACAVNVTEDKPLEIVRAELGTVRDPLLLDTAIETELPAGTGFVRLTVQDADD